MNHNSSDTTTDFLARIGASAELLNTARRLPGVQQYVAALQKQLEGKKTLSSEESRWLLETVKNFCQGLQPAISSGPNSRHFLPASSSSSPGTRSFRESEVNTPLRQTQLTLAHDTMIQEVIRLQETIDQLQGAPLATNLYVDLTRCCSAVVDLVHKAKWHNANKELECLESLERAKAKEDELRDALEHELERTSFQSLQFEKALIASRSEVSELQSQVTHAVDAAVEVVAQVHAAMASGQPLVTPHEDGRAELKYEPNGVHSTSPDSKMIEGISQELASVHKTLTEDMQHIRSLAGRLETVIGNSSSDATGNTAAILDAAKVAVEKASVAAMAEVASVSEAAQQALLSSQASRVDASFNNIPPIAKNKRNSVFSTTVDESPPAKGRASPHSRWKAVQQMLPSKTAAPTSPGRSTFETMAVADGMGIFPWLMISSDENSEHDQAMSDLQRRKKKFINHKSFDGGDLEHGEFAVRDPTGVERLYGWWPKSKCRTFSFEFPKYHQRSQLETPLFASVQHSWPQEALHECLTSHGIDTSTWSDGALPKLQDELREPRAAKLLSCKDGTLLLQLVDLVCVRLMRVRPSTSCKLTTSEVSAHRKSLFSKGWHNTPDGAKHDTSDLEVLCRKQDSNRISSVNLGEAKSSAKKQANSSTPLSSKQRQDTDFIVLPGSRWRSNEDAWEIARKILINQLGFYEHELQRVRFLLPEVQEGDSSKENLEEGSWNITAQVSGKFLGLGGLYRRFIVDVLDLEGTLLDRAPFDCIDGKKVTKWELKPFDVVQKSLALQAKEAHGVAKFLLEGKKLTPWNPLALQQHLASDGIFKKLTAKQHLTWEDQGLARLVKEIGESEADIVRTKFGLARSQEVLKMIVRRELEDQSTEYLVEIGRWLPDKAAPVLEPRLPQTTLCGKPRAMVIGQMLMAEIGVHPNFVNLTSSFLYRHRLSPPLEHFPGLASVTKTVFVFGEMDDDAIM